MSIVNKPTPEVLRNIVHDLKLKNKALKAKVEKREAEEKAKAPFNVIKGWDKLKQVG